MRSLSYLAHTTTNRRSLLEFATGHKVLSYRDSNLGSMPSWSLRVLYSGGKATKPHLMVYYAFQLGYLVHHLVRCMEWVIEVTGYAPLREFSHKQNTILFLITQQITQTKEETWLSLSPSLSLFLHSTDYKRTHILSIGREAICSQRTPNSITLTFIAKLSTTNLLHSFCPSFLHATTPIILHLPESFSCSNSQDYNSTNISYSPLTSLSVLSLVWESTISWNHDCSMYE